MNKLLLWGNGLLVGLVVVLGVLAFQSQGPESQDSTLGGTTHFSGPVDSASGFNSSSTVNIDGVTSVRGSNAFSVGTGAVNASGTVTAQGAFAARTSMQVGTAGDAIVEIQCSESTGQSYSSAVANGTSTISFALTGQSTSSRQAYFVGVQSSTQNITFEAFASTTAGGIMVMARNGGGAPTWAGGVATTTVCYIEY